MNTSSPKLSQERQKVNRIIRVPFPQENYEAIVSNAREYRSHLDKIMQEGPELFDPQIHKGYQIKDIYMSEKLKIPIRRIKSLYQLHFNLKYFTIFCQISSSFRN